MHFLKISLFALFALTIQLQAAKALSLHFVEGNVYVDGKVAKKGTVIKKGSTIVAPNNAKADFKLKNGSLVRIESGEVQLKSIGKKNKLKLNYGKLYSSIKKGTNYQIESPIATAGIRGTEFLMEERDEKSYICVCEGTVWASRNNAPDVVKDVKAGEDLWLKPGADLKAPIVSPDMFKMTSPIIAEMKAVAKTN